jgi:hypothetical protein
MSLYWPTHWTFLRLTGANSVAFVDLYKEGATPNDMFISKGIDGLGAPEIDVSISKGKFQARQPRDRQIVARVGLNPDYSAGETPADLRAYLYGMLTGNSDGPAVSVIVMDGVSTELFRTVGYISKMDNNPFTKDPEVAITIDCLSPYFHSQTPRQPITDGDTVAATANPQWPNRGSAPTGFYMAGTFGAAYDKFGLRDTDNTSNILQFDLFLKLGVHGGINDKILFDTTEGQRFAYWDKYVSPGVYTRYDLLSAMPSNSQWLQLHNGINRWQAFFTSSITWDDIHYTPLHWGV